ncbi:MAG: PHP domain-containing protein [Armatimonadetes bacterium]|nr:PHP domain-containing protein [Armatimonadota bacterium]
MKIDLHTHTTVSDGTLTPDQIIKHAVNLRIEVLSITDHDTIDAIGHIEQIPAEINFINGVEISAEFPKTLHIIGYNFDSQSQQLRDTLKELQNFRKNRNNNMLKNMDKEGFHISMQELLKEAKGEIIGRPHFASLMVKKGYIPSYQEAFDKFLAKGKPLYLDKKRLEPKHAIEIILNAGGIPVIAHPYQTGLAEEELDSLIRKLKDFGLMGIEVFYSQHTKKQELQYLNYAQKYNLLITGGSDFHGENKPEIKLGMDISYKLIQPFLSKVS